ncbi:MAG TPA: glutamine amidotransferase [Steroidobacteraceae bacterium]|nr:glutamine amidotransferase [Steroidobacteraceae bacterium]
MIRTYVICHVAFEDLGLWEAPLAKRGTVRYFQAGIDDLAPCTTEQPDLLVIMGGPISAYETDQYPFIEDELKLIKQRLDKKLPTLGICLGAQMMAAAMGARAYSSGLKEICWGGVTLTKAGMDSCLRHLQGPKGTVLHWHGDTFDLPQGATLLASTDLVKHQAFSIGQHALALQFHLEVDPRKFETWLIGHTCELAGAKIKPNDLRVATKKLPPDYVIASERVISDWLSKIF